MACAILMDISCRDCGASDDGRYEVYRYARLLLIAPNVLAMLGKHGRWGKLVHR